MRIRLPFYCTAATAAILAFLPNVIFAANAIDSLVRKCNSGNTASCAKLDEVARSGKPLDAQIAAIAATRNQALLLTLIEQPSSQNVKLAAVKALTREDLLLQCIESASIDKEVRFAAIGRLGGQSAIARIATSALEPEIRMAAIRRLKDPAVLSDIFRHETDPSVRRAAADQITDPDLIDSLVSVRVLSAVQSPDFLVPRVRPGKAVDGKPEISFGSIRPGKGWIVLSLQLAIQTPQEFRLDSSHQIGLRSADAGPDVRAAGALMLAKPFIGGLTSPFDEGTLPQVAAFWIRAFGGRLSGWSERDSFVIDDGTILDVALPAPGVNPEKQILYVGSKSLGSLESLGLPAF